MAPKKPAHKQQSSPQRVTTAQSSVGSVDNVNVVPAADSVNSSVNNANHNANNHVGSSSSSSSSSPALTLTKQVNSVESTLLYGFIGGSEYVFAALILLCICILAFFCRLFSVVRYESVIHEFDPWFNYRTTRYLVQEGIYQFHNWFDDMSWYPLGRFIGGTLYPVRSVRSILLHIMCVLYNFSTC